MTYQLTALTAAVGSDQIEPPMTGGIPGLLNWVLWAAVAMGTVGVMVGGGLLVLGFHRREMGLDDDAVRHGTSSIIGGALVSLGAGVVNLIARPGSDFAADQSGDAASTVTTSSMPTTTMPTTTTAAAPVPATPAAPIDWTPVLIVAGSIVLGVAVLAAATFAVVRTRSHLADRSAADKIRRTDFAAATAIDTDVADQYAAYLADPYAIFTRPLLDDTSDTLTAAFIDAFADAGAIRPDTCPTETARIDTFRTAAQSARRAWNTADTHARKVGMGPRTDDETRTLRRIRDALALALDDAATPGERENALAAVHRLSEGLITVPERITATVQLQLTGSTRKQLTR